MGRLDVIIPNGWWWWCDFSETADMIFFFSREMQFVVDFKIASFDFSEAKVRNYYIQRGSGMESKGLVL